MISIYTGIDIEVLYEEVNSDDVLVITFAQRYLPEEREKKHIAGMAFGYQWLIKQKINAIHVVSKKNNWYQTCELDDACRVIAEFSSFINAKHRIAYAASMGGYGALLGMQRLTFTNVVLSAPQIAISFEKAEFERRWEDERRNIKFMFDDIPEKMHLYKHNIHIIYDEYEVADKLQINLLPRISNLLIYSIPYSGHSPLWGLNDAGILEDTIKKLFFSLDISKELKLYHENSRVKKLLKNSVRHYLGNKT